MPIFNVLLRNIWRIKTHNLFKVYLIHPKLHPKQEKQDNTYL